MWKEETSRDWWVPSCAEGKSRPLWTRIFAGQEISPALSLGSEWDERHVSNDLLSLHHLLESTPVYTDPAAT